MKSSDPIQSGGLSESQLENLITRIVKAREPLNERSPVTLKLVATVLGLLSVPTIWLTGVAYDLVRSVDGVSNDLVRVEVQFGEAVKRLDRSLNRIEAREDDELRRIRELESEFSALRAELRLSSPLQDG